MRFAVIILLCIGHATCSAQIRGASKKKDIQAIQEDREWNEGSVTLSDATTIRGQIRYNDKGAFFSYNDGENTRVLTARNFLKLSFFDKKLGSKRTFYSLIIKNLQTDKIEPTIFELMKEFKTFAVLVWLSPIEVSGGEPYLDEDAQGNRHPALRRKVASQSEIVFLMDEREEVKRYIEFQRSDNGRMILGTEKKKRTSTRTFLKDEDLLAEYVGQENFSRMKKYASDNALKFRKKEDFLKILEYYETL